MTRPDRNARAVAAELVGRWLRTGDFPDRLLADVGADRAFVMEVVYGVVRWRRALDWMIARFVRRDPGDALLPYLWVGLYQVVLMNRVVGYAAVHETVEAAKQHAAAEGGRAGAQAGFINAVLRRAHRERDALRRALSRQPVGIRLSHPEILVDRWLGRFGVPDTVKLCRWNNARANVTLRVRTGHPDPAAFCRTLADEGIAAAPHRFDPRRFVTLRRSAAGSVPPVTALPGFLEGWFVVQDPSTACAVDVLDPQPGERVLDACAAPGGKTDAIAGRMQGRGELVAFEVHRDRLDRLAENLERLGWSTFVQARQADATLPADWRRAAGQAPFDRILLDVPCTNTGVLRRRADARWRFSEERLAALTALQRRLLDTAAMFLKPGGRLVYSTCSLEPEENTQQLSAWLEANPAFEHEEQVALFPPASRTDGAFAAALRRRAP
jgi:16S rRNA (cytosine967-C5)-methyltransferase